MKIVVSMIPKGIARAISDMSLVLQRTNVPQLSDMKKASLPLVSLCSSSKYEVMKS